MIRKAVCGQDTERLYELVNKAYELQIGTEGVSFTTRYRWCFDVASKLMKDEVKDMYVYVKEEEILGCVKLKINCDSKVHIGPLAVDVNHQGNGIGKFLLEFAERFAPVAMIQVVSCRTDILPFYRNNGYVEVSRCEVTHIVPTHEVTRTDIELIVLEKLTNASCR